jgi:heptosyltransferase-2
VKSLVIRAPNWLGDAVMALPALAGLRAAMPEVRITIAAIPAIAPIFEEETPAAPDEVVTISDRRREATVLKLGKFEAALLLPNSFGSAWIARRAGIHERWGFGGSLRGPLLTRAVARPIERLHQSAYYAALVKGLGFQVVESMPAIRVREETKRRADALLSKYGIAPTARIAGFAPGAAYGHAKRWPPSRVAEVITRATREQGVVAVLVGAPGDREAGREVESALPFGVSVVNLIGRTDLRQLAGVLARCAGFVSNDSGSMHLAAALGAPVTAIFGPTDEHATAPLGDHDVIVHQVFCRPCMLRDCPIDHRCMKRISADVVFDALAKRLGAGSPSRLDAAHQ